MQLIENKISKNFGVPYKTSKLINSKCLLHGLALIKLN